MKFRPQRSAHAGFGPLAWPTTAWPRPTPFRRAAFVCTCLLLLGAPSVRGQTIRPSLADEVMANSVAARSRSNYEPAGISLGAFRLYPSAQAQVNYDDNIYNVGEFVRSDVIATVSPQIRLSGQSTDYRLDMTADASLVRYGTLHSQDNEQYRLAANGLVPLGPVTLDLNGFYSKVPEVRGSVGDVIIGAPNEYTRLGGGGGLSLQLANVAISASGSVDRFDYRPVHLDDVQIPQDYRDHSAYLGVVRLSMATGPAIRVFVQGSYNHQDYLQVSNRADQNSHGYAVTGGISFGVTGLLSAEVSIGRLAQNYDEPSSSSITGFTYSGRFIWNPTTLITVNLRGARSIAPSPYFNQPGIVQDSVNLNVDYELLRNLIISTNVGYLTSDYRGEDREDKLFQLNVNARMLLGRNFEVGLGFNHRNQASKGTDTRPYTGSAVMLSFLAKR